jgi:hypothetical protein
MKTVDSTWARGALNLANWIWPLAILVILVAGGARAQNYVAKDGTGATITFRADLVGGLLYPYHRIGGCDAPGVAPICYPVLTGGLGSDGYGHPLSLTPSGNLNVVITGTLPAFAATPTFNIATGSSVGLAAAASGGCTPGHLITTASLNGTNIKASAGTLCWFNVSNINGLICYAKVYNETTTPVPSTDSAAVVQNLVDPASSSGAGNNGAFGTFGMNMTAGIGFAVTGSEADNDTSNAPAGCVINYGYK